MRHNADCRSGEGDGKGTVMGRIQKSVATLRISGDDLAPGEVSVLLACAPTRSQTKGETIVGRRTGKQRMARSGMWSLECADHEPENLDKQIEELLGKLTGDFETWQALCRRYRVDLFCGLFMGGGNEGLTISPNSLAALGQRGIELALDIYGPA
jgi:hypothetical protein